MLAPGFAANSRGRLIDVCLSLQVQTAAGYVPHAQERPPGQLALNREVPRPRLRGSKGFALRCHHKRNAGPAAASGVIRRAVGYAGVGLGPWISAQKDRVAHAQARNRAPRAGAEHGLVIKRVSDTEPWLDFAPLDVGVMVVNAAKQIVVQT